MEVALRSKQRSIVFKEGAEQFMNGRWMDLIHVMCKIYVLFVHRNDMTWMKDCYMWYQTMDTIQQTHPQDPRQWQQHKEVRAELFALLDRLLRAPHEIYTNVLKEWGVYWSTQNVTTESVVQRNIALLVAQARTKHQSEQMLHMIQMSNESYSDSLYVWNRLRDMMGQIMSSEWLEVNTVSTRFELDTKQNAFDGLVQSFFYLVHSLLYDTTRQFGSSRVSLSQKHLWSLLQFHDDTIPEEYEVMIPSVPVRAFHAMMESLHDPSLDTSAFLAVCLLIAHRVKCIRFMVKTKVSSHGGTITTIADPFHKHQYEQSLLTSHSLQVTHGGTNEQGRPIKNVLEFKPDDRKDG